MAPIAITEAELLDALASAVTAPDEARTAHEVAAETGLDVRRVRVALKRLQVEGRLVVHQVVRHALDGRGARVPAYTILPPRPKASRLDPPPPAMFCNPEE